MLHDTDLLGQIFTMYKKTETISNHSGSSCSKLTMSLVNVPLKLWSLNTAYTYANIFAEKLWVAFAFAKATYIF